MDRRQWLWSAVRAAGASAALMGCAQTPPPTPLAGAQWQLVDLPGQALAATRSYRTGASTLDLFDAQGRTVARFASGSAAAR